jgi:hypothetical protein
MHSPKQPFQCGAAFRRDLRHTADAHGLPRCAVVMVLRLDFLCSGGRTDFGCGRKSVSLNLQGKSSKVSGIQLTALLVAR